MGSQPRGCGFETNYVTNSFLLFFVLILLLKIHNIPIANKNAESIKKEFTIYNMDFLAFTLVQVNQQSQQYLTIFMFIILCAL